MKNNYWLIFFVIVLIADIVAIEQNESLRYFTKPLLMLLLIVYFIFSTKKISSPLKKWIVLGLAFSWVGDISLMFDDVDEIFFITGLVAFLWAHIWYIVFLQSVTRIEKIGSKVLLVAPGLFWLGILMDILNPSSLGILRWPVEIYGVVIITMFTGALHMGFVNKKWFGLLIILGALSFVVSDSLLALNRFYQPFEYAGIAIMSTYGIAQLLITLGAVRYITSTSKHKFAE